MLKLLTAPVTNDRGPRYMERALAAIHQANRNAEPIKLTYATTEGRVGLFVEFADHLEEFATGPITANYPNCALTTVERFDDASPRWKAWFADLDLTPELFPILRHTQFEDLLNGTFADPITAILRATKPPHPALSPRAGRGTVSQGETIRDDHPLPARGERDRSGGGVVSDRDSD